MKKRLEAELISIAHRILKLKNKSEVDQLYKETQKLYETLTVLKFYQDNFEIIKNDISEEVLEEKLESPIEKEKSEEVIHEIKEEVNDESFEDNDVSEEKDQESHESDAVVDESIFKPIFELEIEDETEEEEESSDSELEEQIETAETASEVTPETKKIAVEEFLGENYVDPIFVKPNEVSLFPTEPIESKKTETEEEPKTTGFNEATSKSIAIGLNDRIGFVKHLFDESNEDFNRVISQLNTFDSLEEAKNFIEDMVKPDYNNWQGEEDYAERFMEVVEKKFQ